MFLGRKKFHTAKENGNSGGGAGNNDAALRLVNIGKIYGEGETAVTALKNIDLSFRKSEFVAILGPSGCGKTTLLNIIGGLDRYTSGDLIINGVSTKEYKDGDWDTYRNNSIGFVFQSYNLIPHQTVISNVELALTLSGVSLTERRERAKAVLDKVGLKGLYNKRPNQLSGGQMQRVAIARALVNDPDIILADEPTGALDTETSIQVMDILKEVAKDRLVIMVTHNPDLAEKYATRIINLLDGEKTGDTDDFNGSAERREKVSDKGKSAMKVGTAFSLSFSNLRTKKGRTILTSIAGSIGIIGIALVLAVSTGFSAYINKLQSDTLSVYPLTVAEATIDLTDFQKLTQEAVSSDLLRQRIEKTVYTRKLFDDLTNMLKSNKLTDEYKSYVKSYADEKNTLAANTEKGWAYCIREDYGFDVNNYLYSDIGFLRNDFTIPIDQLVKYLQNMFNEGMQNSDMNISAEFVRSYIPTVSEIPESSDLIKSQYDLIDGEWATAEDELLLVVDKYNRVSDITLALLGFRNINKIDTENYRVVFSGSDEMSFEKVYNKKFYYLKNNSRFEPLADGVYYDKTFDSKNNQIDPDMTLTIKGIARLKDGITQGVLNTGIAYTSAFKNRIKSDNVNSAIAVDCDNRAENKVKVYSWYFDKDQPENSDPTMYIMYQNGKTLLGKIEEDDLTELQKQIIRDSAYAWMLDTVELPEDVKDAMLKNFITAFSMSYDVELRALAGKDDANRIYIYSASYEDKESMKAHMDKWNETHEEEDEVHYSDSTAMLFSALNQIVDAVKIVLIAFTAISLVVSSIMIGIITYVSVVERTKEIGVLRSLGARKKDISRIFNAETFLIGLFAGLIGVGVSYLLTLPINLIVAHFIENLGSLAALRVVDAAVLVVVSFALTLISGIVPARIAANKDPVVALRTE
ncbi:MAG: ABC transporter ATP-binding protein/permease [Clostridia bacterium]|nr:ABC transporter ATP-binding protein/permease [Clostridia bacterium]